MAGIYEKITDSELELMRVLWDAGEALPVSGVLRALSGTGWDDSTIKTLLRRLCKKGAVRREPREVYYYGPLVSREEFGSYAAKSLIDKLYSGSAKGLVAALVAGECLSEADISELRGVINGE